jgi:tetratricopeptide (TPR) repeat protein
MPSRLLRLASLCAIASAFGGPFAWAADDPAEIERLYRTGQSAAALQRADQHLLASPRDPQVRFLKAVILGETPRRAEAIAILEKLTQDYPDLAEPYNNLAVLHAAAGDYPKARAELEQALRLNPRYATAHENLGDVQAALAREAYAGALRLEPARLGVPAKLALVRQLLPPVPAASAASPAGSAPPR